MRQKWKQVEFEREPLYTEVWSSPITQVAAKYEMSDNGLRKVCKAMNIPIPGRGYWAKIAAGQPPKRVPLPEDLRWVPAQKGSMPPFLEKSEQMENYEAVTQWRADRLREVGEQIGGIPPEIQHERATRELYEEAAAWRRAEDVRSYVAHVMNQAPQGAATKKWLREALTIANEMDPVGKRVADLQAASAEQPQSAADMQPEPTVAFVDISPMGEHSLDALKSLAQVAGRAFNQSFRRLHHFAKNHPYGAPPPSFKEFVAQCASNAVGDQPGEKDFQTIQRACRYLHLTSGGESSTDALVRAWHEFPLIGRPNGGQGITGQR